MFKKRIGILTSGGDCPGLNAVIRGAVKASHQMGYDCVGFLKGYEGLYDPVQYVHLTQDSTRGILNQGGTILGSTNKGRFAATVGVDNRQELDPQLIEGVKQTISQLGIDGLICVGGDGSLAVSQQFHEQGIPVVGVPKTIDNDLSATAFTFGFDSAIECATDALDRLHTTAASHERIMVLEVMGRHAGWIALHAGIAGGGDVILIPEIGWDYENLCHKILHRESQGKKFTLVVVAEGAEMPGGDLVGEQRAGQQMKLGGVGRAVAEEIERRLHRETRLCVLGHLQRGGKPTTFDRVLATQFGAHAVRLVHEGRFGEMICSRPPEMTSVPIMEAVNELRRVDPHGPAVQAARALGISFGDRAADEIGQNVFDRLEPACHVADLVAGSSDLAETPEEAAAIVEEGLAPSESPVIDDQPSSTPDVEEAAEVIDSEVPTNDEPSIEQPEVIAEVAEEPSDETSIETAPEETLVEAAAVEPITTEPITTEPVTEEPTTTDPVVTEAVAEITEEPPTSEDADVESVAEAMLDMVAEADEAIHGEALAEEEVAEDTQVDSAVTTPAEESLESPETETDAALTGEEAVAESALEAAEDDAAEATPLESDEPVAESSPKPASPDFAEAQAQLADRIADAAKAHRDAAEVEPVSETDSETVEPVATSTPAPPAVDTDALAARVRQTLAAAQAKNQESLEEPLDNAHDDDLVAEARSALEEALAE